MQRELQALSERAHALEACLTDTNRMLEANCSEVYSALNQKADRAEIAAFSETLASKVESETFEKELREKVSHETFPGS
jgi:hypothetical protein